MMEMTDDRSDDGGGLIEYIGGTDRYFVVLLLDGIEIARRGPYRDRGDWVLQKHQEAVARDEARKARLKTTNAYRPVGRRNIGRNRPATDVTSDGYRREFQPATDAPLIPPSR